MYVVLTRSLIIISRFNPFTFVVDERFLPSGFTQFVTLLRAEFRSDLVVSLWLVGLFYTNLPMPVYLGAHVRLIPFSVVAPVISFYDLSSMIL